jgi:8-oxo-dGTP pyrophosphatase MutT (NUDIX family)
MVTHVEFHKIQRDILCKLLFKPGSRFSELKSMNVESDQFSFHINRLVEEALVKKENAKYFLTNSGKEFANRFDTAKRQLEPQARVFVCVIGKRLKNGALEYLVQKRLKEPYFGCMGFVAGKITRGETVTEAAERELLEETGLCGKVALCAVEHKLDYDDGGQLLDDKFLYVFVADDLTGSLVKNIKGGKNLWMSKEVLLTEELLFDDVKELIGVLEKGEFVFLENKFVVRGF